MICSKLSFIILRHVKNEETNQYWQVCYKQIRKYYPKNKIVIIDDASSYNDISKPPDDVTLIQSEYPGRAELLFYYYFHKYKFSDNALFLHDSAFIHNKLSIEYTDSYKPLWDFVPYKWDNAILINEVMKKLNNGESIWNFYVDIFSKSAASPWAGMYGCMGLFNWTFIDNINKKFNIFDGLLNTITDRSKRMTLERIISILCVIEKKQHVPSIYGDIHKDYPGQWPPQNYHKYLKKEKKKDIEKIWVGR